MPGKVGCTTVRAAAGLAMAVLLVADLPSPAAAQRPEQDLFISGPFSDNMVLQSNHFYGQRSFMSGTAQPGSTITIVAPMREDKGSNIVVVADDQGYWKATLEPVQASMAAHNITISGTTPSGGVYPARTAHGVRYGEVIICGGQSNMDRVVAYDVENGTQEIANSASYPNIFLWTQNGVRPVPLAEPGDVDVSFQTGSWLQASPATVANYSAVCYETGRQLVDRRLGKGCPLGLIWTAVGGTPVQKWMPQHSLSAPGCDQTPNTTAGDSELFDNIIRPLTNYSHRGVLWYQGEANVAGHARYLGSKYGSCFQAMIAGWRDAFGIGDFAFVFVQLAPYLNKGNVTELRLQQASALPSPGIGKGTDTTGMVVSIDQGDIYGGVHSHHKAPVAERAAYAFMHVAYALQPGGIGGTPKSSGLGGIRAFRGPEVTNATLVTFQRLKADAADMGSGVRAKAAKVQVLLQFDDVGAGLRLGDTSSCGLVPNPNDRHWIANRTAQNNTHCSDGTALQTLASSIACCCDSPGNGSFFVCTGSDAASVRISDAAAGCVPARAHISSANQVTVEAVVKVAAHSQTLESVASSMRVALFAVDFPGCALYSSFGLPTAPAFVGVSHAQSSADQPMPAPLAAHKPSDAARNDTKSKSKAGGGFNARPPMGYNTWNAIHTNVDENLVLKIAHVMKDTGLHAAGFEFVNIDDGWEVDRDEEGRLTPDPVRFPSGLKATSDAVHALGLKFGVYTATHEFTCQHRPGSWMHEAIDTKLFCDNHVDFVKIDTCGGRCYNSSTGTSAANGTTPNLVAYQKFRQAFEVCKRESQHEIVEHCTSYDWNPDLPDPCNIVDAQNGCPRRPDLADQPRVATRSGEAVGDIQSNFASILRIIDNSEPCMASVDGPNGAYGGHWLDFDMLEVGNPGLNPVESRSHFTMWAGACSTLLIGTDITDSGFVGSDAHIILTNKELIDALSQDPLGVPIRRTLTPKLPPPSGGAACQSCTKAHGQPASSGTCHVVSCFQLWSKPLADGGVGVILFNRGEAPAVGWSFDVSDVGLKPNAKVSIRDLWAHSDNGTSVGGKVTAREVAAHGVVALRLTPSR